MNSNTVGNMSTFEIRQELDRRGAMDIPDKEINHRTLLQRLVKELVQEEEANYNKEVEEKEKQRMLKLEADKLEREKKKQAALERSKARRADPNYFANKTNANTELLNQNEINEEKLKNLETQENDDNDGGGNDNDPFGNDNNDNDDDPFRTSTTKKRNKIHW